MSLKNDETYSSRRNVCKQHWKRSLLSRCIQIMKRFRTTCSKRPNSALQTFFACSLAGINAPVSKNILNYLKKEGLKEGPCRLFGTSYSSGLKEASLFNGVSSTLTTFPGQRSDIRASALRQAYLPVHKKGSGTESRHYWLTFLPLNRCTRLPV